MSNCTNSQEWRRRLVQDLSGNDFILSLSAYPYGDRVTGRAGGSATKVQATLLLQKPAAERAAPERAFGPPPQETVLAESVITVQPPRKVYVTSLSSQGAMGRRGDRLILRIRGMEGTTCIATGAGEPSYLDAPLTSWGENRADYENRGGEKVSAKRTAPPVPSNASRLFLSLDRSTEGFLSTIKASGQSSNCTGSSKWSRELEGDLAGDAYAVSVRAYMLHYDDLPGRVRASLIHRRAGFERVHVEPVSDPFSVDRYKKDAIRPGAPPAPSASDKEAWVTWAVKNRKDTHTYQAIPYLADQRTRDEFWEARMGRRKTSASTQPSINVGETLLGSAVFSTSAIPEIYRAEFKGPDVEAGKGDTLTLLIEDIEGTACVGSDANGLAYVDVPTTPLSETKTDAANRVYTVTGILVGAAGTPLASRVLIFSPEPGLATYAIVMGQPGPMSNPRRTTDARGAFSFELSAGQFTSAGDALVGYLQVGQKIAQGYKLLGSPIKIHIPDPKATQVNLGRVRANVP